MTLLTRWAATGRRSLIWIIFEKLIQVLRFGCSATRSGNAATNGKHAPNAMGNFCFEATLGYRRLERGR